jgi:excisionase family DNA binding protein
MFRPSPVPLTRLPEAPLKRGSTPRSQSLPATKPAVEAVLAPAIAAVRRRMHTLRQVEEELNTSHSTVYKLLNNGQLKAVKLMGRTLVTYTELQRFLASLPAAFGDAA